jgi:hypothetical protein
MASFSEIPRTDALQDSGAARPSDDLLIRHLGASVLLCWHELQLTSQERIMDQAEDIIGLTPITGVRNHIARLVMRHAPRR